MKIRNKECKEYGTVYLLVQNKEYSRAVIIGHFFYQNPQNSHKYSKLIHFVTLLGLIRP